ncbi:MAG TPA: glutaredoxin family protein, partial [Caldimonas sp.]|nr:glutaredoxin family protein [Caldimonas sp.]
MSTTTPPSRRSATLSQLLALSALAATVPLAHAQYKVIGNDGKVTYTDRAPNTSDARVTALGARAQADAVEPELPFELRQVASKYPVTLYTTTGVCDACAAGRQLLKQRGIPYTERQAVTSEDVDALERLSGGRDAPTLTIGSQVVRGLAHDTWNQYLDAAGYPRESKLP